jgi:hypothetical protein
MEKGLNEVLGVLKKERFCKRATRDGVSFDKARKLERMLGREDSPRPNESVPSDAYETAWTGFPFSINSHSGIVLAFPLSPFPFPFPLSPSSPFSSFSSPFSFSSFSPPFSSFSFFDLVCTSRSLP